MTAPGNWGRFPHTTAQYMTPWTKDYIVKLGVTTFDKTLVGDEYNELTINYPSCITPAAANTIESHSMQSCLRFLALLKFSHYSY